jgi:hypothetical protein
MRSLPNNPPESFRRRNPHLYPVRVMDLIDHPPTFPHGAGNVTPPKRIRQSTKPLMNKLEQEWFHICKSSYPEDCQVLPQSLRFKLGNGIWYKPDVIVLAGATYAYEVKGPHAFRGGFENLKVAAHLYPKIRWTLVWKEGCEWKEQEVLP